jgi:hypothetical protein
MTPQLGQLSSYAGRTVDLLAYRGAIPSGDVPLLQAMVATTDGGLLCTGIQKLAQRWLIEFLTPAGALRYVPARGCAFLAQLFSGAFRTAVDVRQAFSASAVVIQINLQAEDTATSPLDEILDSANFVNAVIDGDQLSLTIQIISAAGTSVQLILPVTVPIG